jgi:hypothetical protein
VHVPGSDEAVRLDEGLDHDRLAARLARRLAEDEALAGDRVLDDVSCMDHSCSLSFDVLRARSGKAGLRSRLAALIDSLPIPGLRP